MTHETIKDKIYEIICNGNHSTESIREHARKLGISDEDVTTAVVNLITHGCIDDIDGRFYSIKKKKDAYDRICVAFALYAGRNLVHTFKDYWFVSKSEMLQFADGISVGAFAFRKRPAVAVYLRMEDDSYILCTTKNIDNRMYIPRVLSCPVVRAIGS